MIHDANGPGMDDNLLNTHTSEYQEPTNQLLLCEVDEEASLAMHQVSDSFLPPCTVRFHNNYNSSFH